MTEIKKNIAIGLVLCMSFFLILWVLLFLHPTFGDRGMQFHVRFAGIEKVSKGSRVTFAGRPVGHVEEITTIARESLNPSDKNAPVYCYDVRVAIDSHVTVYDTDEIMLSTSGLMGERHIAITPKPALSPKALTQGQVVYATELPSLSDTIQQVNHNLQELFTSTKSSAQSFEQVCLNINASWPKIQSAIENFTALSVKSQETAEKLNLLITNIHAGKGSLGRLLTSDELYFKTSALMNKVDLLFNDLNTYGVMYHWNNNWKKEQKAREMTLAKLKNPEDFNQFLSEKLMQISSNINSLKMAAQSMQGIENQSTKNSIESSFIAVFDELNHLQRDIALQKNPFLKEEVAIQE